MARGIPNPDTPAYLRLERRCRYLEGQNAKLRAEVRTLREENRLLRVRIAEQDRTIETLQLQIAELRRMVFGRQRKQDDGDATPDTPAAPQASHRRPAASYRRPTSPDADLTHTERHALRRCPACGSGLTDFKTIERYVEDLLPLAEWYRVLKRITKHLITTGYCAHCRKRVSAIPIAPHLVTLGENIGQFVSVATTIFRLSYGQIGDFLTGATRLAVSDGEITDLLARTATKLTLAFEKLKTAIRSQPGTHYDETSWPVQDGEGGNYAWVMSGTETSDTVFLLGRSRGKKVAEELRGSDQDRIGITDDYGAYRKLFYWQQLCFAHVHRKLRDLAEAVVLAEPARAHCRETFRNFAGLYADVRQAVAQPFDLPERLRARDDFLRRWQEIARPDAHDPPALTKIKTRMRETADRYFTCLTHQGIPLDNNKAERSLRPLVLKRKNCFGSKTARMAEAMSKVYSVAYSFWWKNKTTFFQEFSRAASAAA